MPARKRNPEAKKKRASGPSGPTQPENKRKAQQKKLRLAPIIVHAIAQRSAALGVTESTYVSDLVAADVARSTHQSGIGEEEGR